jgi:WD40 repeat protein
LIEEKEHFDFARGEVDLNVKPLGTEFIGPDGEVEHVEGTAAFGRIGAAEGGADAGHDFAGGEGFPDKVIGTEFEAGDDVAFFPFGREEEDGDFLIEGAEASADFIAVHPGHHDIEADEIGFSGLPEVEGGFAVGGFEDFESFEAEEFAHRFQGHGVVFGEENLALERDDAMESLRVVDLALELNPGNDEAIYFRNFLLATRAFARVVEAPGIHFPIAEVELHEAGFLVRSESGETAVVERERGRLSHPAEDIVVRDVKGLVSFTSSTTGESLLSPLLYSSGKGLSCFSSRTGVLATVSKEEGLRLWDVSKLRTPSARKVISPSVTRLSFERGKDTLWMVNEEASLYYWPSWSRPLPIGKVKGFGEEFFEKVTIENRRDYLWTFWQGGNQRGMAGGKMEHLKAMVAVEDHTRKAGTSVRISTMARDSDVVLFADSAGAIGVRKEKEEGGYDFLPGPLVPVKRLVLSASGGLGAVVFEDGELAIFDPTKREYLRRWKPGGVPVCIALLDSEELLLVGFGDGTIQFVNPHDGLEVRERISVGSPGLEIVVVPHRDEFLTRVDGDLHVRRWDARSGELLSSGMRHEDGVLWFSCSLDGKFLFSIDQKEWNPKRGFLRVWSLRSGKEIVPALEHRAPLNCAVIYENGKRIATATEDGTVRRWSINQKSQ